MSKQFRIWNNKFKTWDDTSEFFIDCNDKAGAVIKHVDRNISEYIIQQFTNALDKNNQQIFEGDIVLYENPDPYDNETQLLKIVGYNSRIMGFRLYRFSHEIDKSAGQYFFPEEVEVIGNIFEGAAKDGVDYGKWLVEK